MSRLLKVLRLLFAAFFRCLVLVSSDVRSTARWARRLAKPRPVFHGCYGLGGQRRGIWGALPASALAAASQLARTCARVLFSAP